jgi:hypothetical protein
MYRRWVKLVQTNQTAHLSLKLLISKTICLNKFYVNYEKITNEKHKTTEPF